MTARIVIADASATNRISLAASLSRSHADILKVATGHEALEVLRSIGAGVVLLGVERADHQLHSVVRQMRNHRSPQDTAILILSDEVSAEMRLSLLKAGADDVIGRMPLESELRPRIRTLTRACQTDRTTARRSRTFVELGFAETTPAFDAPARVTMISGGDTHPWSGKLQQALGPGFSYQDYSGALQAINGPRPPEAIILDARNDPADALSLLPELRETTGTRYAAIAVICRSGDNATVVSALEARANGVVPHDASCEELIYRIRNWIARKRRADHLRSSFDEGLRLAFEDPLTGLHNRRYATVNLQRLLQSSDETGTAVGLLIADIDHFKAINDSYGHSGGDRVLAALASRLRGNLRDIDMVARIGGEEFLIAMPDVTEADALAAAQRLRRITENTPVPLGNGRPNVTVTISIGLAVRPGGASESSDMLVERADRALYRAKADGRNKVTFSRNAA